MGIVLDILRCSLHDGPGIRTTVFLKGCPLSCLWCHNPESQAPVPVLSLNPDRCCRCGACAQACDNQCHVVDDKQHHIDRSKCIVCGKCASACPSAALEIKGRAISVAEIIAEVKKDADYYRHSGGGVTLSGGEPMLQFEFTLALAKAARDAGVHVALETSGVAPADRYRQMLPHVDLFLYDYKGTNPDLHRRHTGVDNRLILSNLEMLYAAGAAIIMRCPMVPDINDTDEHLAAIAALINRYPKLQGVEIMSYHRMGNEKARRAGLPVALDLPNADAAQKERWRSRLARYGCEAITIN